MIPRVLGVVEREIMRPEYPIKYAAMPIYHDNKIVAYIAARCYLTGEHKIYLNEDDIINSYDVVFMYTQKKRKNFPNFEFGKYVNAVTVKKVFDSVVQCKNYAREKNNVILMQNFVGLTYDEIIFQYNNKEEIFKKYYELESELLNDVKIINFNKISKKLQKKLV